VAPPLVVVGVVAVGMLMTSTIQVDDNRVYYNT